MKAFYHPHQALHDPQQFMRLGVLAAPTDLPERTARLLQALSRHGITPEATQNDGRKAAARVHPEHYLAFLETAYRRWRELPGAGPEVLPTVGDLVLGNVPVARSAQVALARLGRVGPDLGGPDLRCGVGILGHRVSSLRSGASCGSTSVR